MADNQSDGPQPVSGHAGHVLRPGDGLLQAAVRATRDGVTITDARDPNHPLIFVNPAFEAMSGYAAADVLGRNCRFLQGDQRRQSGLGDVRAALAHGQSCTVTLRNFRKDGGLFHNELRLTPIRNQDGELTHFIGIQTDVSYRVDAENALRERDRHLEHLYLKLDKLARTDPLTGLLNQVSFDECLEREWRRAMRADELVSVFCIDVDRLQSVSARHGEGASEDCLRRIASLLESSFGRATDFVACGEDSNFLVLTTGMEPWAAAGHGQRLLLRMRELAMPAEVGALGLSIGVSTNTTHGRCGAELVANAAEALRLAKASGGNRLLSAEQNKVAAHA